MVLTTPFFKVLSFYVEVFWANMFNIPARELKDSYPKFKEMFYGEWLDPIFSEIEEILPKLSESTSAVELFTVEVISA